MDMDTENKILRVTEEDLSWILKQFIRTYLYYQNNVLPEKIVFDYVPSIELSENTWTDVKGTVIPVEYAGVAVVPLQDIPDIEPPILCESCGTQGDKDNPIGFMYDGTPYCYDCSDKAIADADGGDGDTSGSVGADRPDKPADAERGSGSGESEPTKDE